MGRSRKPGMHRVAPEIELLEREGSPRHQQGGVPSLSLNLQAASSRGSVSEENNLWGVSPHNYNTPADIRVDGAVIHVDGTLDPRHDIDGYDSEEEQDLRNRTPRARWGRDATLPGRRTRRHKRCQRNAFIVAFPTGLVAAITIMMSLVVRFALSSSDQDQVDSVEAYESFQRNRDAAIGLGAIGGVTGFVCIMAIILAACDNCCYKLRSNPSPDDRSGNDLSPDTRVRIRMDSREARAMQMRVIDQMGEAEAEERMNRAFQPRAQGDQVRKAKNERVRQMIRDGGVMIEAKESLAAGIIQNAWKRRRRTVFASPYVASLYLLEQEEMRMQSSGSSIESMAPGS